jgi:phosphoribosylamine-glycine ligase
MASYGYPGTEGVKVRSGDEIIFDKNFELGKLDYLFCAGVDYRDNKLLTKGGRVLGVTSLNETFPEARKNAYDLVLKIYFDGAQYRLDIGRSQV